MPTYRSPLAETFPDLTADASAHPECPKSFVDEPHEWLNDHHTSLSFRANGGMEMIAAERNYYKGLGVTPTTGTTMIGSDSTRTKRMSRRG